MDLELTGMTALVTGASRGIGFAVARRFALEGCNVHLASRSAPDLESARDKILKESKVQVTCHALDLSQDASVDQLAADCGDVDILVNNAGAIPQGDLLAVDNKRWRELTKEAPFGRLATADELADVIVFMSSARASYVSGTIVTVDGGRTVRNRTA